MRKHPVRSAEAHWDRWRVKELVGVEGGGGVGGCESHVERECSMGSLVESPLDRQLSLYRVSLAE
jgi:hypothetical protein